MVIAPSSLMDPRYSDSQNTFPNWFNNVVCTGLNGLIERLDRALLDMLERREEVKITTSSL